MKQRGCCYVIKHPNCVTNCNMVTVVGCDYCKEHLPLMINVLKLDVVRDERWLAQKKEQLATLLQCDPTKENKVDTNSKRR